MVLQLLLESKNTAVFGVQAISDTVIVTCNSHDKIAEFVETLKKVFISFLKRNLFIRGGVAYSKHFQSGRITYSHAVAKAYEIESKLSIYPRIVFDENIINMYKTSSTLAGLLGTESVLERNGTYFLDILDYDNWPVVYECAKSLYEKDKDLIERNEQAFLKHVWFENYLFSSMYGDPAKERYIDAARHV
ncbi:hypothetical protein [Salicola sp. Rm-C-2C1-2]|uniref:hypothetical protein n=1 Tax=Salicola sp. Rm-C-2C1-2 TaxID=3141321 RepID=UPI0032E4C3DC